MDAWRTRLQQGVFSFARTRAGKICSRNQGCQRGWRPADTAYGWPPFHKSPENKSKGDLGDDFLLLGGCEHGVADVDTQDVLANHFMDHVLLCLSKSPSDEVERASLGELMALFKAVLSVYACISGDQEAG